MLCMILKYACEPVLNQRILICLEVILELVFLCKSFCNVPTLLPILCMLFVMVKQYSFFFLFAHACHVFFIMLSFIPIFFYTIHFLWKNRPFSLNFNQSLVSFKNMYSNKGKNISLVFLNLILK